MVDWTLMMYNRYFHAAFKLKNGTSPTTIVSLISAKFELTLGQYPQMCTAYVQLFEV